MPQPETILDVDCPGPVLLPFLNRWGQDVYVQTGDFDLDPVALPADSTSGSPVLLADGLFVGLLAPVPGGRFVRHGNRLTVTSPRPDPGWRAVRSLGGVLPAGYCQQWQGRSYSCVS